MANYDYPYIEAVTDFGEARRYLLLPNSEQQDKCIWHALYSCFRGLRRISVVDIDEDNLERLTSVRSLIDDLKIPDYESRELIIFEIKKLTQDTKEKLCDDIDSLDKFFRSYRVLIS